MFENMASPPLYFIKLILIALWSAILMTPMQYTVHKKTQSKLLRYSTILALYPADSLGET